MHVPDEANIGPVQAVAIVGAALRFPGALDPASFHELTVSGRRMFRELADETGGRYAARPRGTRKARGRRGRASLRAALLDDLPHAPGRDDDLTGGITARHVLATETAARRARRRAPGRPGRRARPDRRVHRRHTGTGHGGRA